MRRENQYIAAFREHYNAVALATAAALSFAMLWPVPFLAGLVLEAAYLLFVPDTRWYQARLARRFDAEVAGRREKLKEQILATIRPEMQSRFLQLEETRRQIDAESQDDRSWYREILRKLDYLLEKFLHFAGKEAEFASYLNDLCSEVQGSSRPSDRSDRSDKSDWRIEDRRPGAKKPSFKLQEPRRAPESNDRWVEQAVQDVQEFYAAERARIEKEVEGEQDYDTRAILQKRIDVLARRYDFAGKIGKILFNLHHQLRLVEDTFGLINDEIRARSPEQILADIEEVVVATETMSSALEELAPYEQLTARTA